MSTDTRGSAARGTVTALVGGSLLSLGATVVAVPPTPASASASAVTPASNGLRITIQRMPPNAWAHVTITGPAQPNRANVPFRTVLRQSATLGNLTPGVYTIESASVTASGGRAIPLRPRIQVRLTGGNLAPVSIAYKYSRDGRAPYSADVIPGERSATVSWQPPPALRGAKVTSYQVVAHPGGRTCTTTGRVTCTVTGLVNTRHYTFSVRSLTTEGPSAFTSTRTVVPTAGPTVIRRGVSTWLDARLDGFPVDSNGIYVYRTASGQRMRHPVAQSRFAIALLDQWQHDHDPQHLTQAAANLRDLMDNSPADGVLRYNFDFALHGRASDTIHAPWRSAMAQGMYLSAVVRLWQATGDDYWKQQADRTFITLANQNTAYWVSFTDAQGFTWFEEYAGDTKPMQVLNGHNFALFGVYDYWAATDSPRAGALFKSAARTVLHYMPVLREPGKVSWYGVRRPSAQSTKYHGIHVFQLRKLAAITGDDRFTMWAYALAKDYPVVEAQEFTDPTLTADPLDAGRISPAGTPDRR